MKLDRRQFAQLQEALLHSFDRDSLRMMVRLQLDEDLDAVAGDDDLTTVVFDLITWAERTNRLGDLVNGALAANPANSDLQQLAANFARWQVSAPASVPASISPSTAAPVSGGQPRWGLAAAVAAVAALALLAFWLLRPYLFPAGPIEPAPVEPTLPVALPMDSPEPQEDGGAINASATATPSPVPSPTYTPEPTATETTAPSATPTAPAETPQPPRAPALRIGPGYQSFGEQSRLWTVKSGDSLVVDLRRLWNAPEGTPVDCASGVIFISWQVRQPYPGGEELEIRRTVPRSGGRTDVLGSGARGSLSAGYCDELTLHNLGLEEYRVEWRYASALPR